MKYRTSVLVRGGVGCCDAVGPVTEGATGAPLGIAGEIMQHEANLMNGAVATW